MKKTKWLFLIPIIIGSTLVLTGAVFKIQHWSYAQTMLFTGLGIETLGIALMLLVVFTTKFKK
ncbi:MAG: hypothetical protein C0594_15570 [Marinilabiliales bacterium]|nr:MAG: hypothetical protein C0594_15570 [Marinilabiliales bacterium]